MYKYIRVGPPKPPGLAQTANAAAPATTAKKKDAQPEIRANNLPEKVSMGKVDDLLEKRVGTTLSTFFRNASN